jgi:hypothetical protein
MIISLQLIERDTSRGKKCVTTQLSILESHTRDNRANGMLLPPESV